MHLFSFVIDVLEYIGENGNDNLHRAAAIDLLDIMSCFEFVFVLLLMRKNLRITHNLLQVLKRRDQDIINTMHLVKVFKYHLQIVRDDGWESLLLEIVQFCGKHDVVILEMDDLYTIRGRSRRRTEKIINLHFYHVELFYSIIDMEFLELDNYFDELNTNLLLYMACLNPKDSFFAFNSSKLIEFAKFYPCEFFSIALLELRIST
ncbi:hypothetical protein MANES_02G212660v8 [Manihot esculenta]|uniref:Uncharacterized protein n=1 Tax=Manihot esculenta TaxID=3983 RepID=A0A2C9WFW2_MANES|nr:hypothetical protein MANES_02G212660v8 [Manihot esculenta]